MFQAKAIIQKVQQTFLQKRKQSQNKENHLDDPDGDLVAEDVCGEAADPATQQAILDDIAKKAGTGSSSSSSETGPKKSRAAPSVASTTLAMAATRKQAEDSAKGSKKPDTYGKAGVAPDPVAASQTPGVAETGSLAKSGWQGWGTW